MTDRSDDLTVDRLETELVDLGRVLAFPPTPDFAMAVSQRLLATTDRSATRRAFGGALPRRPIRRSLLLAAALVLVVAGAAAAIRVGLDLLEIRFGPVPSPTAGPSSSLGPSPTVSVAPSPLAGDRLGLGTPATLTEAEAAAGFPLLVPADPGDPDRIYVGGPERRGQVAFIYDAAPDLPSSDLLGGAGLLVTQTRGEPDQGLARKLVDSGLATVDAVDIDGALGYWIAGQPHAFWYLGPDGTVIDDSRRLVGDTLIWERDGILYRIEGEIDKARALAIAASMR